jgi:hypothetical protein
MVSARISMISSAEARYATNHPDRGYTCNLADLFEKSARAADQPSEYYGPGFGADDSGYHFGLTGCDGTPASKFQVTAVPTETNSGMKAFCGDESGTIRFEVNGKGATCLRRGQPVGASGFSGTD